MDTHESVFFKCIHRLIGQDEDSTLVKALLYHDVLSFTDLIMFEQHQLFQLFIMEQGATVLPDRGVILHLSALRDWILSLRIKYGRGRLTVQDYQALDLVEFHRFIKQNAKLDKVNASYHSKSSVFSAARSTQKVASKAMVNSSFSSVDKYQNQFPLSQLEGECLTKPMSFESSGDVKSHQRQLVVQLSRSMPEQPKADPLAKSVTNARLNSAASPTPETIPACAKVTPTCAPEVIPCANVTATCAELIKSKNCEDYSVMARTESVPTPTLTLFHPSLDWRKFHNEDDHHHACGSTKKSIAMVLIGDYSKTSSKASRVDYLATGDVTKFYMPDDLLSIPVLKWHYRWLVNCKMKPVHAKQVKLKPCSASCYSTISYQVPGYFQEIIKPFHRLLQGYYKTYSTLVIRGVMITWKGEQTSGGYADLPSTLHKFINGSFVLDNGIPWFFKGYHPLMSKVFQPLE